MTDKELKKLSRLELLNLLLEASKENEELKIKLKKAEAECEVADTIRHLTVATEQINNALDRVNGMTDKYDAVQESEARPKLMSAETEISPKQREPKRIKATASDGELYGSILRFFSTNDVVLEMMPEDIQFSVRKRLESILGKQKK